MKLWLYQTFFAFLYLSSFPALADRNLVVVDLNVYLNSAIFTGSVLALLVRKVDLEIPLRADAREMLRRHV